MDGPTSNGNNIFWNNLSAGTTASNTISFATTGTTDTGFSWYPVLDDKDWLPYHHESYEPKWHILLGYKTQLQRMWD